MAVQSAVVSSMAGILETLGPDYFRRGINQRSALLKSNVLKKVEADGREYEAVLYPSSNHSTGFTLDRGLLPVGGTGLPAMASARPAIIVSIVDQGRAAAKMRLPDKQRVRMLDAELRERAADCGRQFNRAMIGGSVNPFAGGVLWTGTAADSTAPVTFTDVSMFRPGQAVDFRDLSSVSYTVRVLSVARGAVGANSANVAGTVTFIHDVPRPDGAAIAALADTTIAIGDIFSMRGTYPGFGGSLTATGAVPNSFDDMAGASTFNTTFMSFNPATVGNGVYNWQGQYVSAGSAYSQELAASFAARIATDSDSSPDVVLVHPQLAAAHRASGDFHGGVFGVTAGVSAGTPRSIERSSDKYGNIYEDDGMRMAGARVIQDASCPATRAIFFNTEMTRLAVWAEMSPDEEAGSATLLGRSRYTNEVQFSGLMNLITDQRSSVGILDGITNL